MQKALLLSMMLALPAEAAIYRIIDAEGNVTFTDEEPKDGQNFERVELPPLSIVPAPAGTNVAPETIVSEEKNATSMIYGEFHILAPETASSIRENAGNLDVRLAIEPPLNTGAGHAVVLLMDGVPVAEGGGLNYQLTNVDRGTHVLRAEVRDPGGKLLTATEPVTFTLHRVSIRNPSRSRS
jgi:hypothetical protein